MSSTLAFESTDQGFVATITPPRNPLALVVLPIPSVIVAVGVGYFVWSILVAETDLLSRLGWFALIAIFGFGMFNMLMVWHWTAFGQERIEVNQGTLTVNGFGKREQYQLSDIWGLEGQIEKQSPLIGWRMAWAAAFGDSIAFISQNVKHSLGGRLSETDAKTLIEKIKECQASLTL